MFLLAGLSPDIIPDPQTEFLPDELTGTGSPGQQVIILAVCYLLEVICPVRKRRSFLLLLLLFCCFPQSWTELLGNQEE